MSGQREALQRGQRGGRDRPVLSFVVAARNDDHGGGFLSRMQMFVNGVLEQTARYRLTSELIIVEWNPPVDRPRLREALRWPRVQEHCTIRIIEVPPAIHRRYVHSDKLGLFQMIAKNVGIRRARGRFVLCTNIDLLFSAELMRFLATQPLSSRHLYRVDRFDVSSDIPTSATLEEQLAFCRRNIVRVNLRWRTVAPDEVGWIGTARRFSRRAFRVASFALLRMPLRAWRFIRRLPSATFGATAVLVAAGLWVFNHPLTASLRKAHDIIRPRFQRNVQRLIRLLAHRMMVLHTNACGDFTLLSRDEWFRLRGYPEWEMYSFHLDSILCYMAYYDGVREIVLNRKMRVYHIDHHSGWSPESSEMLNARMRSIGVPILDYADLCSVVTTMHQKRSPLVSNAETWGLGLEQLPETNPVAGDPANEELQRSEDATSARDENVLFSS